MASEQYKAYLCSREWGLRREAVIQRSKGICERCHIHPGTAVHHLTYARIYEEPITDLQHICEECHDFTHGKSDKDPLTASKIYHVNKITIDLDHYQDESVLCCPHCGFNYLHHQIVATFERGEDEKRITKTQVQGKDTWVEKNILNSDENPSPRRHGLIIQFWCEGCDAISDLSFAQHKGVTLLKWAVYPKAKHHEKSWGDHE